MKAEAGSASRCRILVGLLQYCRVPYCTVEPPPSKARAGTAEPQGRHPCGHFGATTGAHLTAHGRRRASS